MDKRKFKSKHWHHRVPDFELVYCGPEKTGETGKTRLTFIKNPKDTPKRKNHPNKKVPAPTQ